MKNHCAIEKHRCQSQTAWVPTPALRASFLNDKDNCICPGNLALEGQELGEEL